LNKETLFYFGFKWRNLENRALTISTEMFPGNVENVLLQKLQWPDNNSKDWWLKLIPFNFNNNGYTWFSLENVQENLLSWRKFKVTISWFNVWENSNVNALQEITVQLLWRNTNSIFSYLKYDLNNLSRVNPYTF